MTYKKTTTMLTIVVIAALMVGASIVVALTMVIQGVGIQQASARPPVRAHECPTGVIGPPCGPPLMRAK